MIVAVCGSILVAATCTSAEPARYKDSLTGQAIPDAWFLQRGLPLDDPTVPLQDPDKDGFTNEDEWREHTDPNNPESHPPYHTKLFLGRLEKVPFRCIIKAYELGPRENGKDTSIFQIDTLDLRQPSEFLRLGDMVPNTKFKLEKFVQKFAPAVPGGNSRAEMSILVCGGIGVCVWWVEDVSELTIANVETGEKCILPFRQIGDSPDVYVQFVYGLKTPPQRIRVKVHQEFVLKPLVDDQHHYKLLDANEKEARIQLPTGEIYTVKPDPRRLKSN